MRSIAQRGATSTSSPTDCRRASRRQDRVLNNGVVERSGATASSSPRPRLLTALPLQFAEVNPWSVDRHHFGWLVDALQAFEAESGALAAIGRGTTAPAVWSVGAHAVDPPTAFLRDALGTGAQVCLFDQFPSHAGVERQDLNALDRLPADACDVLAVLRASYFVASPAAFLASARRLRRGGLLVIDWLHGLSDAPGPRSPWRPALRRRVHAVHDDVHRSPGAGRSAGGFDELDRARQPPARVGGIVRPGTRVPLAERIRRGLDRRAGRSRASVTSRRVARR